MLNWILGVAMIIFTVWLWRQFAHIKRHGVNMHEKDKS